MTRLVTGRRARIQSLDERVPPAVVRALPAAVLVVVTWRLSWSEHGSIAAGDWLPYAVLVALVLATVILSGSAVLPTRAALVSVGLLVAFSAWEALSLTWSPVPSLARDEALLTLLYALAFATPLVTLRSDAERMLALGVLVTGLTLIGLAVALKLRFGSDPLDVYISGRLDFPIAYANAQPGIFLVGFWPAVVLASQRAVPAAGRSLALAAAVASASWLTCGFCSTQGSL